MPERRALTVTTTNDMQNSTWAITIVKKPRMPLNPEAMKSASSEDPITISGVAIGRKISTLVLDRPTNWWRTSPNASSVPSSVARIVAVMLTWKLSLSEEHIPSGSQMVLQLPQVNAFHCAEAERPDGLLNDSAMM